MAQGLTRRELFGAGAGLLLARPGWASPAPATKLAPFAVRFPQEPSWEALRELIEPDKDVFKSEIEAKRAAKVLERLIPERKIPLSGRFAGRGPLPARYRAVAHDAFEAEYGGGQGFQQDLNAWIDSLGEVRSARFHPLPEGVVRFEIAGRSGGRHAYRTGRWRVTWDGDSLRSFEPLEETLVTARDLWFEDATNAYFGRAGSFREQLAKGVPYWRSRLDAACGIDVYGQNGIAVADIDGDGWDEVYVCQPGGLPNRLYRRGRDGAFEDITEKAGVGLLDNTSSALFADFRNTGLQDLIVVTPSRPHYFHNRGDGTFELVENVFRFAQAPRGTLTSIAAADYDLDGRLDLYLCTYIYFLSEDQYSYPTPYHDSVNGPPNFLFRNRLEEGFFEDVTAATGLDRNNDRYSFAAAWCDYDGSGRPSLYVANDFGRNNLYRNEDGKFRDVAAEAGVEDMGPGMSAAWLDHDGDGRPDLYVTNMWTAAGQRVSRDEAFEAVKQGPLEEAYRRHTNGNTLFRNRGDGTFEETGEAAMGRWSWAGEGFDFDLDGQPEIYVTAGMITNSSTADLMSFFWRQVVAHSPAGAGPAPDYEEGWNALNQFVREEVSWNGREPNVFHARRGGRYRDFSGVSGLNIAADSRSFAVTDLNGDGRPDLLLKNRLAPQVQAFLNRAGADNRALTLSLHGVESNRDAIGAWVTVEHSGGKTAQGLNAGTGYLCQHSKKLHFGLGESDTARRIEIRWPSGKVEEFADLAAGHHYEIAEGQGVRVKRPFTAAAVPAATAPVPAENREVFEPVWLLEAVPLPEKRRGPGFVTLAAGGGAEAPAGLPVEVVDLQSAPEDLGSWYALFRRYLLDYRGGLLLPLTLLIDGSSRAHKLYPGMPDGDTMRRDLAALKAPDRAELALPFPGLAIARPSRNHFRHGAAFFQAGYPQQALPYLEAALEQNPRNFKALLAVGQIHLDEGRVDKARTKLETAAELKPNSPEAWNNLGGVAMSLGDYKLAAERFEKALELAPGASFALVNAGQAWAQLGDAAKAEQRLRRALETSGDPEAANQLGLLLAKQGRGEEAKKLFERAIAGRRDYASAINNLAVLYLTLNQPDDAVAALRYGIRVAPQEEEMYLNLARVYVQAGDRARARDVMEQLLAAKPSSAAARRALEELEVR